MTFEDLKGDRIVRVLSIYSKLLDGEIINKAIEARKYCVNERTIQRDIDDIRNYFDEDIERAGYLRSIVYDRTKKGYRIEQANRMKLSNDEILAVCKILLDSRAFTKREMTDMLDRLVSCCSPKADSKLVKELICNEEFHYIELRHKTKFLDKMWDIGIAIRDCRYIELGYYRTKDKTVVDRKVKPVAIVFSEYYFYLTAFIDEQDKARDDFDIISDSFPTIYRIDRIRRMKVMDERFHIPYSSRFEEGEFRKRIQFMYGGRLNKITFLYKGLDIDSILDRLPTAKIIKEENGIYTVSAEVFGEGINMWLRSQGSNIELLK